MATSAIVLLIILFYYFTIYDPTYDPFNRHEQNQQSFPPFRTNAIDALVLRSVRYNFTKIFKNPNKFFKSVAHERSFIKANTDHTYSTLVVKADILSDVLGYE